MLDTCNHVLINERQQNSNNDYDNDIDNNNKIVVCGLAKVQSITPSDQFLVVLSGIID